MRKGYAVLAFTIALCLSQVWVADADESDSVKLVTTGRIEKIDTKHKTFQFKFTMDPGQGVRRPVQNSPYPGQNGGRRGRKREVTIHERIPHCNEAFVKMDG